MDKFYFNGLFVRKKSTNIIVLILEILALPMLGMLMYILTKMFPKFNEILACVIILVLYEIYKYLNNKYSKNRGEFIQFDDNKIYYNTLNKLGEVELSQVKEIIIRYPINCLSKPLIYGSFIAVYIDIIFQNNKHKCLNFELNIFSSYSKEKGFDFSKREQSNGVSVVYYLREFLSYQAKKYNFTLRIEDKKFESQWVYFLKFFITAIIFGFCFIFWLPLILFLRDTHNFTIEYILEFFALSFFVLFTGLALRDYLRKYLRRSRGSPVYPVSNDEEV